MRRGDTAMWVLTKMAMLFFIAALAGVLLAFGGLQKTGLCNEEARAISDRIASGLSQAINAPVEDERRIIQLEPSLSLGDGRKARYTLNLTRRITGDPAFNALLITVFSDADTSCRAGVQVTYPKQWDAPSDKRLFFIPAGSQPPRYFTGPPETMAVRPSVLNPDRDGPRSTFVALVKCTQKKTDRKQYVFVQDCTNLDGNNCIGFSSGERGQGAGGGIEGYCGFSP